MPCRVSPVSREQCVDNPRRYLDIHVKKLPDEKGTTAEDFAAGK